MAAPTSILVISPSPRPRPDAATFDRVLDELAARPGTTVDRWYLRTDQGEAAPAGSRVVDDLRTWRPTQILTRFGGVAAALRVNGIVLRRWLYEVDPDIVVLDDGLGGRVLEGWRRPVRRVVRLQRDEHPDHVLEPIAESAPDLFVVPGAGAVDIPPDRPTLVLPVLAHSPVARSFRSSESRRTARRRLDVPPGPLVVGWGDDVWLDGVDLFIRALWALRERHGIDAHGLWIGDAVESREAVRLLAEGDRCGLTDRLHFRPEADIDLRMCADAAYLPYRSEADDDLVREAIAAGLHVVATPSITVDDPAVHVVGDLDVEAAATALAGVLAADPTELVDDAVRRHLEIEDWVADGLTEWCDELLRLGDA